MSNSAKGTINLYARARKINSVVANVAYISTQEKQQEKLIAVVGEKPAEFWERLAADCQYFSRNTAEGNAAREAMEIIVVFPNKAGELSLEEKIELLQSMKKMIDEQTGTDSTIAWHNSHAGGTEDEKDNEHAHVLIPERVLLREPKVIYADCNLFYNEEGKRVYRKSDIMDHPDALKEGCSVIPKGTILNGEPTKRTLYRTADGNITTRKADVYDMGSVRPGCTIVPKGTYLHTQYFSSKDDDLTSKAWLFEAKQHIADWINREIQPDLRRVVADEHSLYVPQYHISHNWQPKTDEEKARKAEMLAANKDIASYNKLVRDGILTQEEAEYNKTLIMLSPDRRAEILNILRGKVQELEPGKTYIDKTAVAVRTRNTDPEKEYLRELYRRSNEAWKAYREYTGDNQDYKRHLLSEGRAASAAIAEQRKIMGMWQLVDYQKATEKARRQREELSAQLRRLNNDLAWINRKLNRHHYELDSLEYRLKQEKDKWFPDENLVKSLKQQIKNTEREIALEEEKLIEEETKLWLEKRKVKKELKAARAAERAAKKEFRAEKRAELLEAREARKAEKAVKVVAKAGSLDDLIQDAAGRAGQGSSGRPKSKSRDDLEL